MRRRASGMERLGVEECARRSGCEFGHSGCDFFRSVEPHEFVRAVHLARSITAFAISAHYASQGTVGFFGALVRGEHAAWPTSASASSSQESWVSASNSARTARHRVPSPVVP